MAPRVTYRRQNSYNTRSNKIRRVKTPGWFFVKLIAGGNVNAQYPNKRTNASVCSEVTSVTLILDQMQSTLKRHPQTQTIEPSWSCKKKQNCFTPLWWKHMPLLPQRENYQSLPRRRGQDCEENCWIMMLRTIKNITIFESSMITILLFSLSLSLSTYFFIK
jgi:ribosomal protein L34E